MLLLSPGALPLPPGAWEGAGKGVGEGEGPAAGEGEGASANKRAYMPKNGVHGLETCTSLEVPKQLTEAHRCTREPKGPPTMMLPAASERFAHVLEAPLTTLPPMLCVQDAQSG